MGRVNLVTSRFVLITLFKLSGEKTLAAVPAMVLCMHPVHVSLEEAPWDHIRHSHPL